MRNTYNLSGGVKLELVFMVTGSLEWNVLAELSKAFVSLGRLGCLVEAT